MGKTFAMIKRKAQLLHYIHYRTKFKPLIHCTLLAAASCHTVPAPTVQWRWRQPASPPQVVMLIVALSPPACSHCQLERPSLLQPGHILTLTCQVESKMMIVIANNCVCVCTRVYVCVCVGECVQSNLNRTHTKCHYSHCQTYSYFFLLCLSLPHHH